MTEEELCRECANDDFWRGYQEGREEAADALEAQARRIEELEVELKVRLPIQEYKAHLKARIAELEAALKPFIEAEALKHTISTGTRYEHTIWELCVSEAAFRAARAAYLGEKG